STSFAFRLPRRRVVTRPHGLRDSTILTTISRFSKRDLNITKGVAMYSEFIDSFGGQRVVDFESPQSWTGPGVAYRLREEYEDETSIADRLDLLLKQPGAEQLTALIMGAWSGSCEGGDSAELVSKLVQTAHRLPNLRALFLGEMTYEECEISWINQSDVSPA